MRRGNGITRQFPKIVSRKGQLQEKSNLPPKRVRNKNHLRGEVKFSRKKSTSSTLKDQPFEHHISKPLFRTIKIRVTSNIIHKEKPIYQEKPRTTNSNRQSKTADSKEEDRRGGVLVGGGFGPSIVLDWDTKIFLVSRANCGSSFGVLTQYYFG